MQNTKNQWLALCYSVPASPSKARVYVWRHLKHLEAQPLTNGVAVLPNTKEYREDFSRLAEKIISFQGEATLLEISFSNQAEEALMAAKFSQATSKMLKVALEQCADLLLQMETAQPTKRKALQKALNKRLNSIKKVSSNPLFLQAEEIENAVGEVFSTIKKMPADFFAMLRQQ